MKKRILFILVTIISLVSLYGCDNTDQDPSDKFISGLSYNGENITWNAVEGAQYYTISINGLPNEIVQPSNNLVAYLFDSELKDFTVTVIAVIEEGSDYNPNLTFTFKFLGQVENLTIESGIITWDDLPDAEGYQIASGTEILDIIVSVNQFEIPKTGTFNYRFKPIKINDSANNNITYYSVWSEKISGEILDVPENINYDSEIITWDAVTNASSYIVEIDEETFEVDSPRMNYQTTNEDFNLRIKAVGQLDDDIYDSVFSEELHYQYFGPVENLNVVSGSLTWDPIVDADGYKIRVDGVLYPEILKTNEFDGILPSQSTRISVIPYSENPYVFSEWSNEIIITTLQSPIITYSDQNIIWNQVSNAAGYQLIISKDGDVLSNHDIGQDTFVFQHDFAEAGTYEIKVKATSTAGTGYYESKYSQSFTVVRLAPPQDYNIQNQPLERENVMVTLSAVPYATGFDVEVDGIQILQLSDQNAFEFGVSSSALEQSYSVDVYSVGYIDLANKLVVLGSIEPLTFNVVKLAIPTNITINGNQVSWNPVNNTSSYIIDVNGTRYLSNNTSFTLPDLPSGNHDVKVRSMGDGEMVLSSDYSIELDIQKLNKPSNLAISEGILSWDSVTGATSYDVSIGTTSFTANTNSFNLNNHLSLILEGQGVQISVKAIGNGEDIIDSNASDTQTLSKLSAPQVSLTNDNIIWNPVKFEETNITTYMLYINDQQGIQVSGTSYALDNLSADTHSVYVIALGNLIETVNSPKSNTLEFTKLAQPNVSRLTDSYQWDAIAGAVDYEYKFSTQDIANYTTETSIEVNYTKAGVYKFMIRAIGDGANTATSAWTEINQTVQNIATPSITVTVDGNQATITVNQIHDTYLYNIGTTIESSLNEYTYVNNDNINQITVSVKVIGGYFVGDIYFIDSNYSAEQIITFD